jgi:hypothetical protein
MRVKPMLAGDLSDGEEAQARKTRVGPLTDGRWPFGARIPGAPEKSKAAGCTIRIVGRGPRHLIQTGARADELQRFALSEGMRTLRQDGIEKVLAGITSIEEVRASS